MFKKAFKVHQLLCNLTTKPQMKKQYRMLQSAVCRGTERLKHSIRLTRMEFTHDSKTDK